MKGVAEEESVVEANPERAAGKPAPEDGFTVLSSRKGRTEAFKGAAILDGYGWCREEQILFPEEIEEFAKSVLKSENLKAEAGHSHGGRK
jgi:hypothetical protein